MTDRTGPPSTNLWKTELRRRLLDVRRSFGPAQREAAAAAISRRVLALPELDGVTVVAAYVGHGGEPPTLPLLDALRDGGRTVLLPVLLADDDLAWAAYGGRDALVPGRHDLPEPAGDAPRRELAEAGLVLAPGLGFDPAGRRLGRGGGSYDRALARVAPGTPVVGLAYDECVVAEVPVDPHDRPVRIVVTPTRVLRGLDAGRPPRQN